MKKIISLASVVILLSCYSWAGSGSGTSSCGGFSACLGGSEVSGSGNTTNGGGQCGTNFYTLEPCGGAIPGSTLRE